MKKKVLLFFASVVVALLCVSACSSDDDENAGSEHPVPYVSYHDKDPYLAERQGYWYNGTFIRLTPQENPPYYLLVKWNNEGGKQTLNHLSSRNDGVVVERYDKSDNMAVIVSNKYIASPYFYVSSSYKMSDGSLNENGFITVNNVIVLKLKEGKSIDAFVRDYAETLIHESSKAGGIEVFRCKVPTSYEVLQLADKLIRRNDVEWAEPDMYGGSAYID